MEDEEDLPFERVYHILDTRNTTGNCAVWWGRNAIGYCCDLSEAGVWTEGELPSLRETDRAVPCHVAHRLAKRHVNAGALRLELSSASGES